MEVLVQQTVISVAAPTGAAIDVEVVPRLVVENATSGPPGPPGGTAGVNFTQSTPSSVWTINHNLGYRPGVELFDTGGNEFVAQVLHTSVNQVVVTLADPIAGSARLV